MSDMIQAFVLAHPALAFLLAVVPAGIALYFVLMLLVGASVGWNIGFALGSLAANSEDRE